MIFSFVVDSDPRFAFEGYHLARSLAEHCGRFDGIHVNFTPPVTESVKAVFGNLGCQLHNIESFGDGKHCNKVAQLENLKRYDFDVAVLLDTDMIAIADFRAMVSTNAIQAKVVDLANPSLSALKEIAAAAGLSAWPPEVETDAKDNITSLGNCNGGFYSVPRSLLDRLSQEWRYWTLWLLDHNESLRSEGKEEHVDQVSMWLSINMAKLCFAPAPSNVNYYVHFTGQHSHFDASRPIALLHYHSASLNVLGLIEPKAQLRETEQEAVDRANAQIRAGFDNRIFWDLRYSHFVERGSGVESRGSNLEYKRQLLRQQGIESADSVLDFGCGDLEVMQELNLKAYVGVDQSDVAITIARRKRPDWAFVATDRAGALHQLGDADWVVCMEVLIHQQDLKAYNNLIEILAAKTRRVLIVSGYDRDSKNISENHMLFFYEPLADSLRGTGRFSQIEKIGSHTDVSIYRCER